MKMNLTQCVPSCELDDVVPITPQPLPPLSSPPPRVLASRSHSLSTGPDTTMLDYEMAELAWENGQLTVQGLGLPRMPSKSNFGGACTLANGTLESIVNQATKKLPTAPETGGACKQDDNLVPASAPAQAQAPASVSMTMDALVPNHNNQATAAVGCSTRVGSCSAAARVPVGSDLSVSASGSGRKDLMKRPACNTCEELGGINIINGLTSTSFGMSPENTKTITVDDDDSVGHTTSNKRQRDDHEKENQKKGTQKSSVSTKRSRAAAIHNQSERKRRDKINQRMKTLQKLVPNSNKTDKASMLDEVIDYLKQLQAQVEMMSRMMSIPSMMMPMAMQHQLQMSMMSPMSMGMGMDHINISRPNIAGIHPSAIVTPANFMPLATWNSSFIAGGGDQLPPQATMVPANPFSTYLTCQSQPMTMDAYSRMAAMYLQLQQQQQPGPTSNT